MRRQVPRVCLSTYETRSGLKRVRDWSPAQRDSPETKRRKERASHAGKSSRSQCMRSNNRADRTFVAMIPSTDELLRILRIDKLIFGISEASKGSIIRHVPLEESGLVNVVTRVNTWPPRACSPQSSLANASDLVRERINILNLKTSRQKTEKYCF